MTDEELENALKDFDRIASAMASYFASLMSNGLSESVALQLTESVQDLWFRKILGLPINE